MTTVFVVTYDHPQYGQGLEGVFASLENAEKEVVKANKAEGIDMSQYEIEWEDETKKVFYHEKWGITYVIYVNCEVRP